MKSKPMLLSIPLRAGAADEPTRRRSRGLLSGRPCELLPERTFLRSVMAPSVTLRAVSVE
jgi:hypothetical protein